MGNKASKPNGDNKNAPTISNSVGFDILEIVYYYYYYYYY
jgi:hypothetical protein